VARGAVLADPAPDLRLEPLVESGSVAQDDEERHAAAFAGRDVDDERVETSSSARTLR
jgi:hypothetical protein